MNYVKIFAFLSLISAGVFASDDAASSAVSTAITFNPLLDIRIAADDGKQIAKTLEESFPDCLFELRNQWYIKEKGEFLSTSCLGVTVEVVGGCRLFCFVLMQLEHLIANLIDIRTGNSELNDAETDDVGGMKKSLAELQEEIEKLKKEIGGRWEADYWLAEQPAYLYRYT